MKQDLADFIDGNSDNSDKDETYGEKKRKRKRKVTKRKNKATRKPYKKRKIKGKDPTDENDPLKCSDCEYKTL